VPYLNDALPFATKMDAKGLDVLVSLRHWAGSLDCSNCKLSVTVNEVDVNYVWRAIQAKTATNSLLKAALQITLAWKTFGSESYNRIFQEIGYLGY